MQKERTEKFRGERKKKRVKKVDSQNGDGRRKYLKKKKHKKILVLSCEIQLV